MKGMDVDLLDAGLTGENTDRLGNNMILVENPRMDTRTDFPFRSNTCVSILVLGGSMECIADMVVHRIDRSGLLVILPTQIVEKISFSDDFRGYCLLMSAEFDANLPMGNKISVIANIREHGFFPMEGEMMDAAVNYVKMVQGALRSRNNYQYEIVMHLTVAYYYGLGTYIHDAEARSAPTSRYEQISDDFIRLVRDNCHIHRNMDFYADALCLSAKHVNLAVKTATGINAMKWIERYTVLNAKNMLKTTSLTVSEISDRLNFPTPSDFGKYFRKFTGYSPRAYRNA